MSRHREASRLDEDAITPVIGSIMILGISVLGITAVLFWGAPALQIMQEQNAQAAMLGEFQEIRQNSLVLTITDSSRLPRLNLEGGDLLVEDGTMMAITVLYEDPNGADPPAPLPSCRMDLDDWDGGDGTEVSIRLTDCAHARVETATAGCPGNLEALCVRAYTVDGRLLTQVLSESNSVIGGVTGSLDLDLPTVLAGQSWVIRLEDKDGTGVYAETWILHHQALHWKQEGRTEPFLHLEAGAMFSGRAHNIFLEEDPPIAEQAFGTDELALRIPLMEGPLVEKSGAQSIVAFLRLDDNILRVDDSVTRVQYDFEGRYAEAWCTAFSLRGSGLTGAFAYTESYADRRCADPTHADGRTTIVFDEAGAAFPFAFTHVQISLQI